MSRIAPKAAFDVLGVTPEDDFATIRAAWKRLVRENHPDVAGGDIEALTQRLADLNEAYDALRWHNPRKVEIRQQAARPPNTGTTPSPKRPGQSPKTRRRQTASAPAQPTGKARARPATAQDSPPVRGPAAQSRGSHAAGLATAAARRFEAARKVLNSAGSGRATHRRTL